MDATGIAALGKYRASYFEAFAVLKAHEPRLADTSSALHKEWVGAQAPAVCKKDAMVERINCIGSILRPIWERDAPESILHYDEYQKKHLGFARDLMLLEQTHQ
jgi:hypothetical protein